MERPLDEAQSATGFGVDLGNVRFPQKLGADTDSKRVVVVSSRDVHSWYKCRWKASSSW